MDISNLLIEFSNITNDISDQLIYYPNALMDTSNILLDFKKTLSETNDLRKWAEDSYQYTESSYMEVNFDPYSPLYVNYMVGNQIIKYYIKINYPEYKSKVESIHDSLKDIQNYLDENIDFLDDTEIEEIEYTIDEYSSKLDEKYDDLRYLKRIFTPPKRSFSRIKQFSSRPIPTRANRVPVKKSNISTKTRQGVVLRDKFDTMKKKLNLF